MDWTTEVEVPFLAGAERYFCHHHVQTGSEIHPAFHPIFARVLLWS